MGAVRIFSAICGFACLGALAGCMTGGARAGGAGAASAGGAASAAAAAEAAAARPASAAAESAAAGATPVAAPQTAESKPAASAPATSASATHKPATKVAQRAPKSTPVVHERAKSAAAEPRATPPPDEVVAVALDKLPLTIHGEWILDRSETLCTLKSVPQKMDDGQGGTDVTLSLAPGSLLFHTRSAIDPSYAGTGVTIDGDRRFSLETVEHGTDLRFGRQRQALLAAMQSGRDLQLTLGFWPTWPVTHTYSVDIPLQYFPSALQAWKTCNRLLGGH